MQNDDGIPIALLAKRLNTLESSIRIAANRAKLRVENGCVFIPDTHSVQARYFVNVLVALPRNCAEKLLHDIGVRRRRPEMESVCVWVNRHKGLGGGHP